jgi:hypothetical protein
LNEVANLGLVNHGITGRGAGVDNDEGGSADDADRIAGISTIYWDGGIVENFPTIDEHTVMVTPLNGLFDPNPPICPRMPEEEVGSNSGDDAIENGNDCNTRKQQRLRLTRALLLNFLRP